MSAEIQEHNKDVEANTPPIANLLLAEIAMVAGTKILQSLVEKSLLKSEFTEGAVDEAIEKAPLPKRIAASKASSLAKKSLGGAAILGLGLGAASLYKLGQKRRARQARLPKP